MTKYQIEKKTREKNILKVTKSIEKKQEELIDLQNQMAVISADLNAQVSSAQEIRARVKEANDVNLSLY